MSAEVDKAAAESTLNQGQLKLNTPLSLETRYLRKEMILMFSRLTVSVDTQHT